MTRWTVVAIAVALVGCNKGERALSRNTSDSAAAADSAMTMPASAMPSDSMSADARPADSSSMRKAVASGAKTLRPASDTKSTTPAPASTDTRSENGPTGAEAMTGVRPAPSGAEAMEGVRAAPAVHDLTADQAKQLQAALNKAGCNAGTADGLMGRQTQRAISCGLNKYKLGNSDMSELYRKLGLDF